MDLIIQLTLDVQFDMNSKHLLSKTQTRAYGDVAQMGERGVRNAEARGSSPLISIPSNIFLLLSIQPILPISAMLQRSKY